MSERYDEADIREYLDREAIRDVLMRYSHGVDRCDGEVLKTVYWPEAIDDHGRFVGKRDEFIAWVMPHLLAMGSTQHFLGNILIRIDGMVANSETYFQAFHRMENSDGKPAEDLVICGRYLDRMEKRAKEWRLAHRVVAFDHFREYSDSGNWANAKYVDTAQRVFGAHDPTDPSCALFGDSLLRPPFL
jgi:SnoaL-like protein